MNLSATGGLDATLKVWDTSNLTNPIDVGDQLIMKHPHPIQIARTVASRTDREIVTVPVRILRRHVSGNPSIRDSAIPRSKLRIEPRGQGRKICQPEGMGGTVLK